MPSDQGNSLPGEGFDRVIVAAGATTAGAGGEDGSSPSPGDASSPGGSSLALWQESVVEAAVKAYGFLESALEKEWEEECSKYEDFEPAPRSAASGAPQEADSGHERTRPRRNYANPEGAVHDPTMYPYHTSLYPLLDAYDPLYEEEEEASEAAESTEEQEGEVESAEAEPPVASLSSAAALRRQPVDPASRPPNPLGLPERVYRNRYVVGDHDADGDGDAEDDEDEDMEGYTPASVQSTVRTFLDGDLEHPGDYAASSFYDLLSQLVAQCLGDADDPAFAAEIEMRKPGFDRSAHFYAAAVHPVPVELAPREGRATGRMLMEHQEQNGVSQPPAALVPKYGIEHLPLDPTSRSRVLLRLFRHSLSELQRDYRLAMAAAVTLFRYRDFDDVHVLSQFLAIYDLEYGPLYDVEDECIDMVAPTDPFRFERWFFGFHVHSMIGAGMLAVTRQHAVALSGFCWYAFDREMGHLRSKDQLFTPSGGGGDASGDAGSLTFREKQRRRVKRYAFNRSAEEDNDAAFTSSKKVPVSLILKIIRALGYRGVREKHRLVKVINGDPNDLPPKDVLLQALESYNNCLLALVDIGEAAIKLLPTSDRFYNIGSFLVFALVQLLVDGGEKLSFTPDEPPSEMDEASQEYLPHYLADQLDTLRDLRLNSPSRFADCIADATNREKSLKDPHTASAAARPDVIDKIDKVLHGRPPAFVHNVVRSLFVRELVDIRVAGCGYTDFCLWCRFDCTPLDPAMFWHDTTYPDEYDEGEEEDEDENEEDEDDRRIYWETDEDGNYMTRGGVRSRFDHSLLLLVREWNQPWSPERHMSFQPEFRSSVKSVSLCSRRTGLPSDVSQRILEFLHRDWWPDSRRQCWNYDCQVDMTQRYYDAERCDRPSHPTRCTAECIQCPGCKIATYCSEACRVSDWKHFHKSYCNFPPCRIPGPDEETFLASLDTESIVPEAKAQEPVGGLELQLDINDKAEEDGSVLVSEGSDEDWEDVESEGEEANGEEVSRTERIYRYFYDRSYRHHV